MSTKHNAMFIYGLYLDEETLTEMYNRYYTTNEMPDKHDMLFELCDAGLIDYESDFTGEIIRLDENGMPKWGYSLESYWSDAIGYVQLPCQPSLLKGAYNNWTEAIEDVRAAMSGLLPDDFDYRGNLCLICGTYYG